MTEDIEDKDGGDDDALKHLPTSTPPEDHKDGDDSVHTDRSDKKEGTS